MPTFLEQFQAASPPSLAKYSILVGDTPPQTSGLAGSIWLRQYAASNVNTYLWWTLGGAVHVGAFLDDFDAVGHGSSASIATDFGADRCVQRIAVWNEMDHANLVWQQSILPRLKTGVLYQTHDPVGVGGCPHPVWVGTENGMVTHDPHLLWGLWRLDDPSPETLAERCRLALHEAWFVYNAGAPGFSDAEFDLLESWAQSCGVDTASLRTAFKAADARKRPAAESRTVSRDAAPLPVPMPSLEKIRDEKGVISFLRGIGQDTTVLIPKFDGISLSLMFAPDGNLHAAYTKNTETDGIDVTHIVCHMRGLPAWGGPVGVWVWVRVEALLRLDTYERLLAAGHGGMANARSAVAGRLNRNAPDMDVLPHITLVPHDIRFINDDGSSHVGFDSRLQMFAYLGTLFPAAADLLSCTTMPALTWTGNNADDEFSAMRQIENLVAWWRDHLGVQIDGAVVSPDNMQTIANAGTIGSTGKPFMIRAIKSDAMSSRGVASVSHITWAAQKDCIWYPTVEFTQAVEIGGVNVTRVTGKNARFIWEKQIGAGAEIVVVRSGDVIPNIAEVLKPGAPNWPAESEITGWQEASKEDLKAGHTVGPHLLAKAGDETQRAKIVFFLRQIGAMGVDEKTVEALYAQGVRSVVDLFTHPASYASERTQKALRNAVNGIELAALAHASGVFGAGIGKVKLGRIVETYKDTWLTWDMRHVASDQTMRSAMIDTIGALSDWSTVTATVFVDGLLDFQDLWAQIEPFVPYAKPWDKTPGPLSEYTITFTGFRDDDLKRALTHLGATIKDSLTAKVNLVIAQDNLETSDKIVKALKIGVPVWREYQARLYVASCNPS